MNIFNGFKEATDIADINKGNKTEISQKALDKFDQIMGDKNLPESKSLPQDKNERDTLSTVLQKKFDKLFEYDTAFILNSEQNENDNSFESTATHDSEINTPHEPNSQYKIGEDVYETDDTGKTYKKNGEILPNTEYTVNGNTYRTDENGNKISCDAEPKISDEGKRNITEQRESGGEDRKEGDQGGHIIARILGGSEGNENLVPMRGTINQGDYKKMELEIKKALDEGKNVKIHIDLKYDENSSRPTKIIATYTIDGKKTEIIFDNKENSTELMDSLQETISDKDYSQLKDEIDDMKNDGHQASITSVKTEFDENGNFVKVVVGVLDESTGTKTYKTFEAR